MVRILRRGGSQQSIHAAERAGPDRRRGCRAQARERGGRLCQCRAACVSSSLAGSPVHEVQGRTVVPLLHPELHSLPFAVALELHRDAARAPPAPLARSNDIYVLSFILDGRGALQNQRDGRLETLQAGDTVLMNLGAAHISCPPTARGGAAPGALSAPCAYSLASLVVTMPRSLVDAARDGSGGEHRGDSVSSADSSREIAAIVDVAWGPRSSGGGGGGGGGGLPPHSANAVLTGSRDLASRVARSSAAAAAPGTAAADGSWWADLALGLAAALGRLRPDYEAPIKRTLQDLTAFRLPNQTNRLALVFDPLALPRVPFVFGVEIFEPAHRTHPHVHPTAHEVFFILSGEGEGFCDGRRFPLAAGDVVCFRPGSEHGIDNGGAARMYCLELMMPDEAFAELVRAGQPSGGLADDDLCVLARIGCGG